MVGGHPVLQRGGSGCRMVGCRAYLQGAVLDSGSCKRHTRLPAPQHAQRSTAVPFHRRAASWIDVQQGRQDGSPALPRCLRWCRSRYSPECVLPPLPPPWPPPPAVRWRCPPRACLHVQGEGLVGGKAVGTAREGQQRVCQQLLRALCYAGATWRVAPHPLTPPAHANVPST